ncbi:MAG TPA: hypothetical protein VMT30_02765 [Candidatus Saccharimonadia bacterium]|nr:hypothetical protein [Candidatus Saccharimonadia bacterium]
MIKEIKEFFIASAHCYQVKNADGSYAKREDDVIWLGESEDYPACWDDKLKAKEWKTIEEIRKVWLRWDGMPWWNRLKPESLQIFRVIEERTYHRKEQEIRTDNNQESKCVVCAAPGKTNVLYYCDEVDGGPWCIDHFVKATNCTDETHGEGCITSVFENG